MIELNALHKFEMPKIGIYFLFKNDELVYIGKTTKGLNRIMTHLECKEFDSYSFHSCTERELNSLEIELIKRYRPSLNKTHNKGSLEHRQKFVTRMHTMLQKDIKEHIEIYGEY